MRKKNVKLWQHLMRELSDFEIQAGWFENSKYDADTPIAGIAAVQNYGAQINQSVTPKQRAYLHYAGIHLKKETSNLNIIIPARPFMDNAKKRIQGAEGKEVLMREMLRVFEGWQTMLIACDRLAKWAQGVIQEEIIKMNTPPLKRTTVRAREKRYTSRAKKANPKTAAKPLVDLGIMLDAVQGKAELKKK